MITRDEHPVGWAALMYELEDAHEHLGHLIEKMASDAEYSEGDLRVELGHVYSHLNRAWNGRDSEEGLAEHDWTSASAFPSDLDPV